MRANRCGIQPQSRLAQPSVHHFPLYLGTKGPKGGKYTHKETFSLNDAVQDWQNLFDPGNETGGQMPAIQIIWDAFVWRFGDGVGAVIMMMIPLVASYGSSMSTVTSAAR